MANRIADARPPRPRPPLLSTNDRRRRFDPPGAGPPPLGRPHAARPAPIHDAVEPKPGPRLRRERQNAARSRRQPLPGPRRAIAAAEGTRIVSAVRVLVIQQKQPRINADKR